MTKHSLIALNIALIFAGSAIAAPEQVVTVETVQTAPRTEVTVVETAPAAPAVVDVPMVRDLNTPAKKSDNSLQCKENEDAQICIEKVYQNFMRENGFPLSGKDKKGKTYFFGDAQVNFAKTNSSYGRSLSLAYTEAYINAVRKFSESIMVTTANEIMQSAFADSSSDAREFPKLESTGRSDWEALYQKTLKFAQANLDAGLRKLGVDPSQYDAVPPDEKKKLLENALINKTTNRTSIALGGINVVGNFVHETADGRAHVGVVIAYSPAIEGVAQSLASGQKPAIKAVGQPLDEQIPVEAEELYDMYGPRLMIDDQGPVIVSFAFWSPEQSGSANFRSRYREAAYRQADAEANAQIARFLSLSFSGVTETETGSTSGKNAVKSGANGSIFEEEINKITDRSSEENVSKTQATLTGLQTVRRWIYQTPDGHELVGVVKAYSFGNIEYSKSVRENKTSNSAAVSDSTSESQTEFKSNTRTGRVKSAIDVF